MRQVKYHLQRYGGDATEWPLDPDLVKAVKQARAKNASRVRAEDDSTPQQPGMAEQKKVLEDQVSASKALLKSAEDLISSGVKQEDLEKIQSGHVLLTKGNTNLQEALGKLQKLNKQIYKRPKQ